jgi:GDP-mannose transporter
VDALEWEKVKAYIGVVAVFVGNIFTNIKALEYSNVETVIVFQTLTSLGIAYGDYKYLNTGMPSNKIIVSLLIVVFGAFCYVMTDSSFRVEGYFWVVLYFIAKITEMLYTKHILDTVPMTSWGRSFYNNFLGTVPCFCLLLFFGENTKVKDILETQVISFGTVAIVAFSCAVGLGISIAGFMCRELISATSFSVVGNMNKVLAVFINFMIWDYHASSAGLISLSICLAGGAYYSKVKQDQQRKT